MNHFSVTAYTDAGVVCYSAIAACSADAVIAAIDLVGICPLFVRAA